MISYKQYIEDLDKILSLDLDWEKLRGQRFLITGANGLIGSSLVDLLLYANQIKQLGLDVTVLVRNKEKALERFKDFGKDAFHILCQDVRNPLPEDMAFDYIVNAASNAHPRIYSKDPVGTLLGNIQGLNNLLSGAVKYRPKRILEISSSEVYGERSDGNYTFKENEYGVTDCNRVRASYPEGKRACEALCQGYIDQYGLDIVLLRPSRIYGPMMTLEDSRAMAQFLKKAVAHETVVLKSKGEQVYSFAYATDNTLAILYVLLYGKKGEAYNVGDRNSIISLKEFASIAAAAGGTSVKFELPDEVEAKGYSNSPGMILDCTKLEALGWKAQTDIKSGIQKTIDILTSNN